MSLSNLCETPMYEEATIERPSGDSRKIDPGSMAYDVMVYLKRNTSFPPDKIMALTCLVHDVVEAGYPTDDTIKALENAGYSSEEILDLITSTREGV